ncbi:MAG: hypothetical protein AAF633_23210, partial [Chloroflexota bacterium]
MDRTVPTSGNEDIILYMRTYYSLLRSSREVPIRTVLEAHMRTNSALHVSANEAAFDISAFSYALSRLPKCFLHHVQLVVMGQSNVVFAQNGYPDVEKWEEVTAPARRRRTYWDGDKTMAVYIASRSDIDDLIPMLAAYQIERDKLQLALTQPSIIQLLELASKSDKIEADMLETLATLSGIPLKDFRGLQRLFGLQMAASLLHIVKQTCVISVRLLAGSFAEYKRATRRWWDNIDALNGDIHFYERPIYFISSNTHSLANLLSGYARSIEAELIDDIRSGNDQDLIEGLDRPISLPGARENLLYYALKRYEDKYPETRLNRLFAEGQQGLQRIPSQHVFDIEAQVVDLSKLDVSKLDSRLPVDEKVKAALAKSNALMINIDYPLGMAAYQILSEIARNIADIRGIFIMGKAATLNGRVGDVMIPNVVHDEHSSNTYLFENRFTAADITPYLSQGAVLDNQKAITVPGTFLQNHDYMSVFYKEGYTDLEMEAGPYLNCVYELIR